MHRDPSVCQAPHTPRSIPFSITLINARRGVAAGWILLNKLGKTQRWVFEASRARISSNLLKVWPSLVWEGGPSRQGATVSKCLRKNNVVPVCGQQVWSYATAPCTNAKKDADPSYPTWRKYMPDPKQNKKAGVSCPTPPACRSCGYTCPRILHGRGLLRLLRLLRGRKVPRCRTLKERK